MLPSPSARSTALLATLATLLADHATSAQTWNDLTPVSGSPSPRGLWSAVYDSQRHRAVLFGGQDASGHLDEIWAFDLATNTWADLTPTAGPAPAPRRTPNSVYDPANDRMITWSGQGGSFFNDSWIFDFTTNAWTELTVPDPKPNIRYGVASTWDPVAEEMVSFAGFTGAGRFQDTWRLDATAGTWTDVTPAVNPAARCLHNACYDALRHRMIMYGGQITGPTDDIWAFDLTLDTWTELTPAVVPLGRWFAASAYDVPNDRVVVFGGDRGTLNGGPTNEVQLFRLDQNEWQELVVPGPGPGARSAVVGIHVPGEDRMVVFGGHDGTNWRHEVWSLDGLSDAVSAPLAGVTPPAGALRAYPNPFRTATTLEVRAAGAVTVSIRDVAGRLVRTLRGRAGGGALVWDGRDEAGRSLAAGVYWSRIENGVSDRATRLVRLR